MWLIIMLTIGIIMTFLSLLLNDNAVVIIFVVILVILIVYFVLTLVMIHVKFKSGTDQRNVNYKPEQETTAT